MSPPFRLLGSCVLLCFLLIGIVAWDTGGWFPNQLLRGRALEEAESQVTTEPSTTKTTTVTGDALQRVLGLGTKMPYPVIVTLGIVKPLVMVAASGPPDADKKQSMMSKALMTFTIVSFFHQAITDICGAIAIFANNKFSIWERFNLAFATFCLSPNPATLLSLNAMGEVYGWVARWRQWHGDDVDNQDLMYNALGDFFYYFIVSLTGFCCIPTFLPLILYILPAAVAYIWISVPVYGILSLLGSKVLPFVLVKEATLRRFVRGQELLPVGSVDPEQVKAKAKEEGWDIVADNYEANLESYQHTNAPLVAWNNYFWDPIAMGLPLLLFGPLAARLYSGCGYMESVTLTFGERSISGWMKPLLLSALEATDKADKFAAAQLVRKWLIEATYVI